MKQKKSFYQEMEFDSYQYAVDVKAESEAMLLEAEGYTLVGR